MADRTSSAGPDDATVRRIVDALAAPATADELADEERYVAAFVAARASRPRRVVDTPVPAHGRSQARRFGRRLAIAGGVATLAVTGTAAALTATLGSGRTPTPPRAASGASRLAATTPAPPSLTGAQIPRTATSSTPGSAATSAPASPTPGTPPARRGSPPTGGHTAPTEALRAYCRSFERGTLKTGNPPYRTLAAAAGGADRIPAYCAVVAPTRAPHP